MRNNTTKHKRVADMNLKQKYKHGDLLTAHVDYVKFICMI